MKNFLWGMIHAYQLLVSPFLGRRCRFVPSCSEYAKSAVAKFGARRGGFLSLRRLCRCHPWHKGGADFI